jgi:hypothetical protein
LRATTASFEVAAPGAERSTRVGPFATRLADDAAEAAGFIQQST